MGAIVAAVIGAAGAAYGAYSSGQAAKQAAAGQGTAAGATLAANEEMIAFLQGNQDAYEKKSKKLIGEGRQYIDTAYGNINSIINNLPSIQSLLPQGKQLSRDDFDFRTGLKRENLKFVLGGREGDLRDAQDENAALMNLNDSGFTGQFRKILNSNILGLKASTVGEPLGSFANLSAKNLYDFSQRSLGNYLQIGNFFSKEGTVDPISPLQTTFDLYKIKAGEANMKIGNEQFRSDSQVKLIGAALGVEDKILGNGNQIAQQQFQGIAQYNQTIGGLAGANSYANAQTANGIAQAIGTVGSAYSNYQSQQLASDAMRSQISYNNSMTAYHQAQIGQYAPSSKVSTSA